MRVIPIVRVMFMVLLERNRIRNFDRLAPDTNLEPERAQSGHHFANGKAGHARAFASGRVALNDVGISPPCKTGVRKRFALVAPLQATIRAWRAAQQPFLAGFLSRGAKSTIASLIEGLEAAPSRFLPPSAPHYNVAVRSRSLALGLITLTLIFAACRGNAQAAADTACRTGVSSMLVKFLAGGDPFAENPLFSLLSRCADLNDLSAMLEALARPPAGREPLEIEGAIEAALRSPALARNVAATQLIVDRFQTVRDSGARASLSYLLGRRSAADALNRILRDDLDPYVRAAAVVSLRICKTPPAFATLWRAAKSDPDSYVRAQAYQTLDRFRQLHTRDDLLAASRTQTDAGSTGRFLGRWLKTGETPEDQTGETFTRLAEHTGSSEASGALSEIFKTLQSAPKAPVVMTVRPPLPLPIGPGQSQATVMAPIQSIPIAPAEPEGY